MLLSTTLTAGTGTLGAALLGFGVGFLVLGVTAGAATNLAARGGELGLTHLVGYLADAGFA